MSLKSLKKQKSSINSLKSFWFCKDFYYQYYVIKIVYWSKKTTQTIEKNIAINALFGEGGG